MARSMTIVWAALSVFALWGPSPAAAQQPEWSTDLGSAWREAQTSNRPLVMFVTSDHCPYCHKMRSDTLADPAVARRVRQSYVGVMVDTESSSAVASRLRITSVPTTLLVLPDGRIADRVEGYVPPERLLARLNSIADGTQQR